MRRKITFLTVCFILFSIPLLFAQNINIRGTVTGDQGIPLSGVSVTGEKAATTTDATGTFSIEIAKGTSITYSYVGMTSVTRTYTTSTIASIVLTQNIGVGDEVVVIGYGTKKKRDLSTAISSINSKDISDRPGITDAAQALQGKVSGVTIVQGSGAPGGTGGTGIKIRGISSLTGTNNPLIVLDGYPLPDQSADNILNSFGVDDIESIDVLKDAGSANIYGVRAANGVVIITTKRGKAGKSSVKFDYYRGIQEAWRLPNMLNAREYAILNTEARVASGLAPIPKLTDYDAIATQYGEGEDWLGQIFRRAAIQNISVTASGGSDKAQYLMSASYFTQDGILYNTDFERFNLRFNGDVKVNNRFRFGNSLGLSRYTEHGADTYTAFNSIVLLALTAPPTVRARNEDGTYGGGGSADGFSEPNPIYQLEVPQNNNVKYRVNGNLFGELQILNSLKFKTLVGGDFSYQEINNYSPATPSTGGRPFLQTGYFVQKGFNPDYVIENTLTFDKLFASRHKINAVLGQSYQQSSFSYVLAGRSGTFNIRALDNQVFIPTDLSQTYNGALDGIGSRFQSYFGRVNYDFDNRGYFSAVLRRDGTSNFAPENKFAYFPSVSAAWRLTAEPFLADVNWLNDFKVRASFGYTGNPTLANNGPSNPAYRQIINQTFQYTFGNSSGSGGTVSGAAPSRSFNPDIRWEKNEQLDLGFDAAILKNRVTVAFDVYQRLSKDLLLYVAPPLLSGTFEAVPYNTGVLRNRGVDLTIGALVADQGDFTWNTNLVLGAYKNKVTSLGLSAPLDAGFTRITGGSLRTTQGSTANYFYGFVTDGIFQDYSEISKHAVQTAGTDPTTSTAPGDIRFKDLNGDGVINDQDRTNIGNAVPDFTYGLTNIFRYRNFELNVFVQGSQGNKVLNFTRWYTEGGVSNGNYSNKAIGRWTGPGSSNEFPRLILNDPNGNNRVSDRFVEDGSYLRIKNVRLAYNIPANALRRINASISQVYISAQNLATFTNYSGLDPEVGGSVDYGFYPQARTLTAGVSLSF